MKKFLKYAKPYTPYFIIGPLLMLSEVVGDVALPYLVSLIINNGVSAGNTGFIIGIGALMALVAILIMGGGVGGSYFATKASVSFAADLRQDVFNKVQTFSFKNIDSFSTGSLVTRMTNDITQIQNVMRMCMIVLLRGPGMLIGALFMASRINTSLAMVILFVIPVLAILIFLVMKTAFPRFDSMQKKLDALNSKIQENLTNVRVIKSFVRGDYEAGRFEKANGELKDTAMSALTVVILTMPIMMLAMNFTTLAVVWFGGNYVIEGHMAVGDLTAFTTYVVQILMSLMMLSQVLLMLSRALASAERVSEILDTHPDITDENSRARDLKVKTGLVEFKNVSFKYSDKAKSYILKDINLTIMPGTTVGIIGATGSGKSTLVQLIPRLYDATVGEVLVDGVNVRDYSIHNLRDGVGMVLQKNVLFSGTIEENLRWGDADASEEEIRSWADAAQADEFVTNFTDGYDTWLGQGGVNVSGGQKQRLCIARALLKKPKILILDDSTSAVDTATEAKIRATFAGGLKDATKIIIAQRISSVMEADEIIVLEEGEIVGAGNHEELLKTCEIYRDIYYSQTEKEAVS